MYRYNHYSTRTMRTSSSSNSNYNHRSNDDDYNYDDPESIDKFKRRNYVDQHEKRQNYNNKTFESETLYQESHQVSTTSCDKNYVNDNSFEIDDNNREMSSILINSRIVERLRQLIEKHPNGIWCRDLPTIYVDTFGASLNYTDIGFESVREFASSLPNVFHCVQIYKCGDYKLYNAKNPRPAIEGIRRQIEITNSNNQDSINNNIELKAIPSKLELRAIKNFIPDNVMSVTESVGQILVKNLCKSNHYEEIVICEVFTPSHFYFHLIKNLKSFKNLMHKLHEFYEENKTKFQIAPVLLKDGLNVACIFENQWHRAIIKTVTSDGRVKVEFYDYGTVKTYGVNDMFFLHKQFSNLPAQAILCGLHNVKPIDKKKWEPSIIFEFTQKTQKKRLCAMISSINEEENSSVITLVNTNSEEDLYINDWLIAEGYASVGRFKTKDNRNFSFCHYKKSLEHKGYNTTNITNNTNEPLLNGSFKFSCSDISVNSSRKMENTVKHNSQEEQRRNIKKIPSLLDLKIPQSIKNKLAEKSKNSNTLQSSTSQHNHHHHHQENVKDEQMSCPKVLRRTLALISKNEEKKNAENILSPLSSSVNSSNSSDYVNTTESLIASNTNSSTSSKITSRREMLLRYMKRSPPSVELNTTNSCEQKSSVQKNLNEEKRVDNINRETKIKEISEHPSLSSSTSDSVSPPRTPLHLKEKSLDEEIPDFGTLRSQLGGRGQMLPIDWNDIRRNIKQCDIKNTVSQIKSKLVNENKEKEEKKEEEKQEEKEEEEPKNSIKPKVKTSLIQTDLSRFINNININSILYEKRFNFTTSAHVKSNITPISPSMKLVQRIHGNIFKSTANLITPNITKKVTGTIEKFEEKMKEIKIIEENKENIQLVENKRETLETNGEKCVTKLLFDLKLDEEKEENNILKTEISIKDNVTKNSKIQVLNSSESLDSDDFSDELSDSESEKKSIKNELTIHEKYSIKEEEEEEEEEDEGEKNLSIEDESTQESLEKKNTIVDENPLYFNDMDVLSDSGTWDGMSFSGEMASFNMKRRKSISSQVSSRVPSPRPIIDLNESLNDQDIINFQYNEFMSRKKQEINSNKITIESINESESNSKNSLSTTENNIEEIKPTFQAPGRSGSLMRMLSKMKNKK
ncbi:epidermal growth factor receptor substrate 15 homolog isoform X2 [Leptopilina boulardi]|uniref:epidermal growth factor receptor substrate 15 homolog isoform X2 n=1 Tax=Leptopilina boulardi TaxID=63433 RepID=UPI0021F5FF27|nr:epidermal growth factor receptor substrate 15 homolog isoform X2 [Leptopilina boulardi]